MWLAVKRVHKLKFKTDAKFKPRLPGQRTIIVSLTKAEPVTTAIAGNERNEKEIARLRENFCGVGRWLHHTPGAKLGGGILRYFMKAQAMIGPCPRRRNAFFIRCLKC